MRHLKHDLAGPVVSMSWAPSGSHLATIEQDVKSGLPVLSVRSQAEAMFTAKTGLGPEDVRGKLVLDAGIGAGRFSDVLSRSLGSSNPINVVHATVAALKSLSRPEEIAAKRGLPIEDVAPAAMLRARAAAAGA